MAYRKSHISTTDFPMFDGRMDYLGLSDLQLFLEWLRSIDMYLTQYMFSDYEKVRFAITKLTGQASRYWINLKPMRASRGQEPIDTWSYMKDELKGKYLLPHYCKHLLDKWRKISQGNKSAKASSVGTRQR